MCRGLIIYLNFLCVRDLIFFMTLFAGKNTYVKKTGFSFAVPTQICFRKKIKFRKVYVSKIVQFMYVDGTLII